MAWGSLEGHLIGPVNVAGEDKEVRRGAECATGHKSSWEKARKREEVMTELMEVLVT